MNLNIVNYEMTRHLICTYVFLLFLTMRRNQRTTRTLLKKNQEISRNSRFLNLRQEIQCQEMVKTRKTKFFILKIKTRQEMLFKIRNLVMKHYLCMLYYLIFCYNQITHIYIYI